MQQTDVQAIQQHLQAIEILATSAGIPMDDMLEHLERQFIAAALQRAERGKGRICKVARKLGRSRNYISNAAKRLGLNALRKPTLKTKRPQRQPCISVWEMRKP